MTHQLAAGIDIGGTNISYGLITEDGKILARDNVRTNDFSEPQKLVKKVSDGIRTLLSELNKNSFHELKGVRIGAPNGNYYTGAIEFAPNMNWKGIVPLAKYFSEELQTNAVLTNDANAAAFGEMIFGGAKNMKDFVFVTLGTGLGSGIVVNGKLIHGHDGFAGELGHIIIEHEGRPCGCGRKGCLETYCSATGIKRTYADLLLSKHKKINPEEKSTDAKYICDKAIEGEPEALEAFRYTGEKLGYALADTVSILSPEAIFLFGGLAQAGDLIFNPTIEYFEKKVMHLYKNKVKIIPSQLKENEAALLGAAATIWQSPV